MPRFWALIAFIVMAFSAHAFAEEPIPSDSSEMAKAREAAAAYRLCLNDAFLANARVLESIDNIAAATLRACKLERTQAINTYATDISSIRIARNVVAKTASNEITKLRNFYKVDTESKLTILALFYGIYTNCAMANRQNIINGHDNTEDDLINDYAYYRNDYNRKKAYAKFEKIVGLPQAKIDPEKWCQKVADDFERASPELKRAAFVE